MRTHYLLIAIVYVSVIVATSSAAPIARYDFTKGTHGWQGNRHTTGLKVTAEGLAFRSTDVDPWLTGPVVEVPANARIRFTVCIRSSADGTGRLFWGAKGFSEERAENIAIRADGEFHETSLTLSVPSGPTHFRLDPATEEGSITIRWIAIQSLPEIKAPPAKKPIRPTRGGKQPWHLASGELTLTHYRQAWGDFVLSVAGTEMASGHVGGRLACEVNDAFVFLGLGSAEFAMRRETNAIVEHAVLSDPRAGTWTLTRRFETAAATGIKVTMSLEVHDGTRLMHYPWLTLFPGLGTFGQRKTQALVPGVEYLADEPGSSKADIATPAHLRRIPDPHKVCFPLVAFCHEGRCFSLRWDKSEDVALVHDSPDRVFNSGAHLVGLWAPNVGRHRLENDLHALDPVPIDPAAVLRANAVIHGCRGDSVVPAIREYVTTSELPAVPELRGGFDAAVELMAAGWTRSSGYDGTGRWKHAVWGRYKPQPAADACAFSLWLSRHTASPETRSRLETALAAGLDQVHKADPSFAGGVSHVRPPAAPFLFGDVAALLRQRQRGAMAQLKRFEQNGTLPYRHVDGKPDFSSTHFANHANGYAASHVSRILAAAFLTGNRKLAEDAVALLDKQTRLYANTVPRGAQTWELALHTPDILAAGHMVACYVTGYRLTGRRDLLEQAIHWAWTGVPFVYLDRSTGGEVGDYATIPVLGATQWRAPLWIGLPVQWCGRVYASALEALAPLDPDGPWDRIARGITASALQQTWQPPDKRQGLLPDFFNIPGQHRDGPAINPGTVQSGLPYLYGRNSLFDSHVCRRTRWIVHAPGSIRNPRETADGLRFELDGWGEQPYALLLVRVAEKPDAGSALELELNAAVKPEPVSQDQLSSNSRADPNWDIEHHADEGWLVISGIKGAAKVEVRK